MVFIVIQLCVMPIFTAIMVLNQWINSAQVWHGDEGTWETYGGYKPANATNLREDFNMFDDDLETYWHSLGVRNSLQINY